MQLVVLETLHHRPPESLISVRTNSPSLQLDDSHADFIGSQGRNKIKRGTTPITILGNIFHGHQNPCQLNDLQQPLHEISLRLMKKIVYFYEELPAGTAATQVKPSEFAGNHQGKG